jgi:hypothetical protein
MGSILAACAFQGFDVDMNSRNFLAQLADSGMAMPADTKELLDASILAGFEDWNLLLHRARSLQRAGSRMDSPDGQDLLSYVPKVLGSYESSTLSAENAWAATDRYIQYFAELLLGIRGQDISQLAPRKRRLLPCDLSHVKRLKRETKSPFWAVKKEEEEEEEEEADARSLNYIPLTPSPDASPAASAGIDRPSTSRNLNTGMQATSQRHPQSPSFVQQVASPIESDGDAQSPSWNSPVADGESNGTIHLDSSRNRYLPSTTAPRTGESSSGHFRPPESPQSSDAIALRERQNSCGISSRSYVSPYFASTNNESPPKKKPNRPPRGTVSALPVPPLSAPRFGLLQEDLANDTFRLLVGVTFLIRTTGRVSIPVFHKVMETFPTPEALADPGNAEPLTAMTRHLGLSVVRVAAIQRYARRWVERPAVANVRYRVKDYASREVDLRTSLTERGENDSSSHMTPPINATEALNAMAIPAVIPPFGSVDDVDAWEIGHLTQGQYAIDSWRIFCRDMLLGRAEDWNGKGREPTFQPEWMRVLPADKELRACLRWMWMRENWEWDAETGEKTVLGEEMRRAVNEGRVFYDDQGKLKIREEASDGT